MKKRLTHGRFDGSRRTVRWRNEGRPQVEERMLTLLGNPSKRVMLGSLMTAEELSQRLDLFTVDAARLAPGAEYVVIGRRIRGGIGETDVKQISRDATPVRVEGATL